MSRYDVQNPRPGVYWVRDAVLDRIIFERATEEGAKARLRECLVEDARVAAARALLKMPAPRATNEGQTAEPAPDSGWVEEFNHRFSGGDW